MKRLGLGIIVALLAPATADATTYCVSHPTCGGTNMATLQQALDAAAATPSVPDNVLIGPGTFPGPFTYDPSGATERLTITGWNEGGNRTVLTLADPSPVNQTVLTLFGGTNDGDVSASHLDLVVSTGNYGVRTTGEVTDVRVTDPPGANTNMGILLYGDATAELVKVHLDGHDSVAFYAGSHLSEANAGTGDVYLAEAEAATALMTFNPLHVHQARLLARARISQGCRPVLVEATVAVAVNGDGFEAGAGCGLAEPVDVDVRHVTLVREGTSGGTAFRAVGANGSLARVLVRSSIARGFASYAATGAEDAMAGSGGRVEVSHSAVDLAAVDPGAAVEDLGGNIAADPRFVDAAARDFHLQWPSPVIDRGNPAGLTPEETPRDVEDASRILDGDADGVARRDMGAHEYAGPAPKIVVSPDSVAPGQAASFDATASVFHAGPATFAWKFDDGTTAGGAFVTHAFAVPGAHTVTLTVTDAMGRKASATGSVGVNAGPDPLPPTPTPTPAPTVTPPPPDTTAPVLTSVGVSRRRFVARRGARLRWTVSEDARLAISLQRCRKAKGRRCLRWAKARTTTRLVKTGPGTLQLGRTQVRRGRWRARLVATDAAGNRSRRATVGFTVTR